MSIKKGYRGGYSAPEGGQKPPLPTTGSGVRNPTQELADLDQALNERDEELAGWKRTALAMRDAAIVGERNSQACSKEIQDLYFNAAMKHEFAK